MPGMRPEWQAHIDELLAEYRQKQADLKKLQETMASAEATVTAADDMVTVRVGPQGRLLDLQFNPRVYRRLSPSELAEAVLTAVQEATARVGDQVRTAMEPLRPDNAPYEAVAGEGLDLSKFLPEHPEDFEALKERYGFRDK
jgi:DNA-binding protein YbaB